MLPPFSKRLRSSSKASFNAPGIATKSVRPRAPCSAMANTDFSAVCSSSELSRPSGWKPSLTMSVPTWINCRSTALSRTISA
ncbi:hypothetical protein D3C71_1371380 [compost metagenome]